MVIRDARPGDWDAMWPIVQAIVTAGETFPYDRDMDEAQARATWVLEVPARTVVAVAPGGAVVGTANMHANRGGPGAHVASASFMVAPEHEGRGVGRALVEEALAWARDQGFRAMQFNAVAASNVRAVALYRSLGFEIVGTVPEAFRHPVAGYVGLHVMHRAL